MQNKLLLSIILCFLSVVTLRADEDAKKIKATLDEATVFLNGAELMHRTSSPVTKGVNAIWISELSPNIDVNSLKISTTKGVIVASHEYSLDFITKKEVSSIEKNLKDSVKFYKKVISEYSINTKTNSDLLGLLQANKSIGGSQTGLSVAELMKMVDYYKLQSNELNKAQVEIAEKQVLAQESLNRIEKQLLQESAKNTKAVGVLKLNLTSPMTTTTDFTITYYTRSANWVPYYDINVPGEDQKIQIASKAKVAQTTGLDWNKVKIILSTATPSVNKEAPLFNAWFLDFMSSQYGSGSMSRNRASMSQNAYSYDMAPQASEKISIRGASTLKENVQPLYIINGEPAEAGEFESLSPEMIESMNVLKDASATSLYGSRASNGVVIITTKSMTDLVKRDEGELNTVYNIDLPYTILGNGKAQSIDLQTQSVGAEFKHYSVPKLDKDVFILAEISDWQKLGLLSGKANVTFAGTYVGETVINASSVMSKLALTLGADKRVTVKREKLQDFSSRKFLGKDTKQDFTYKITVKNNQNRTIKMVLKDQYPLTKQKDIQVELLKETTPATYTNEDVGVYTWNFDLEAGQTKEFRVAYSVKYPKDQPVNLD